GPTSARHPPRPAPGWCPVSYPATPLLARLTVRNGWHHDLVADDRGEPIAMVAVRVGPVWTDSVAIAGENETVALRHPTNDWHPTNDYGLILPAELASESGAVWRRHGRCEEVLAELFELPDGGGR
ncbi:MAG: hypothetical protein ACRDT0_22395, partial [Pseudonocardiaceae bacterium]